MHYLVGPFCMNYFINVTWHGGGGQPVAVLRWYGIKLICIAEPSVSVLPPDNNLYARIRNSEHPASFAMVSCGLPSFVKSARNGPWTIVQSAALPDNCVVTFLFIFFVLCNIQIF
ncbi:hypothetical protein ILYODFUR_020833 [Ilyodon furcidens]|uniref:Uncharacterized protein n=1 Tax=Ilyodon furcidens TaxID=33524 RepID=A0ABV0T9R9_9TELE